MVARIDRMVGAKFPTGPQVPLSGTMLAVATFDGAAGGWQGKTDDISKCCPIAVRFCSRREEVIQADKADSMLGGSAI